MGCNVRPGPINSNCSISLEGNGLLLSIFLDIAGFKNVHVYRKKVVNMTNDHALKKLTNTEIKNLAFLVSFLNIWLYFRGQHIQGYIHVDRMYVGTSS